MGVKLFANRRLRALVGRPSGVEAMAALARLWPGAFVTATLVLGVQADALVVPAPAVQSGQQGSYVFVVRDDRTVDVRPVKADRQVGGEMVIADGLQAGETVVTEGQLRLAPGVAVEIDQPRTEGAASPRT